MASLAVVLTCLLMGAIGTLESRHIAVNHGTRYDWPVILSSTTPRWILLAATLPFVLQLATRFPVVPWRGRHVALHAAVFAVLSVAHAGVDAWAMTLAAPEIAYFFGWVPRMLRAWYNTLPTLVSSYVAVLVTAWGMHEARERQRRTVRALQLESQLQSARLAALRAQLQPHFLYNTLNGIAALVADAQPVHAVAAIEQLGELLHASLREDGREEVTVTEEVALAQRYLALQGMRFGDRLRYDWIVGPEAAEALVPVLLLQPIVENAVVHGLDAGVEALTVRITAAAGAERITLTVENDGAALAPDDARDTGTGGHGLGVAATRARLATAYGERASLSLLPRPEGGVTVRIELPRIERRAASFEPLDSASDEVVAVGR